MSDWPMWRMRRLPSETVREQRERYVHIMRGTFTVALRNLDRALGVFWRELCYAFPGGRRSYMSGRHDRHHSRGPVRGCPQCEAIVSAVVNDYLRVIK